MWAASHSMGTCGKQPEFRRASRCLCPFPPLERNSWLIYNDQGSTYDTGQVWEVQEHCVNIRRGPSCYITAWGKEEHPGSWLLAELWSHWGLLPHLLWSVLFPVWVCFSVAVIKHWHKRFGVERVYFSLQVTGPSSEESKGGVWMLPQACSGQGGTTHSALGPLPLISNQETGCPTEPIRWWQCLSWSPFFPALSHWQPRLAIILPKEPTSRCHQLWIEV